MARHRLPPLRVGVVVAVGASSVAVFVCCCTFSLAPLVSLDASTFADAAASDAGDSGPACTDDLDSSSASCGACGHDCGGGTCLQGQCQPVTLITEAYDTYGLTADDRYLYYTIDEPIVLAKDGGTDAGPDGGVVSAGSVRRLPKDAVDGGAVVLAAVESSPHFIVLDANQNLYWTSARGISTMRADGSTASSVVCAEPSLGAFELAVDTDGTVFYTVIGSAAVGDVIRRCDPATGAVTTIATTFEPKAVAVDDTDVWWTSFCDPAHVLPTSDCDVDGGTGSVRYAPKTAQGLDGGTLRAAVGAGAEAIVLAGADVYITTFDEGSAYFLTKTAGVGSSVSRLFPPSALYRGAERLLFDPQLTQRLYMAAYEGYLLTYDVGTQAVTPLPIGGSSHLVRVVVDDSYLYWTTGSGNTIERLRK